MNHINNDDGQDLEMGSVRVLNNNTICFDADISDSSVGDFLQILGIVNNQLRKAAIDYQGFEPRINLLFSTNGGAIYDAFRLCDAIENSDVPVDIYASGSVASSGLIVLLSGARKYTYPNTMFLYHQISGGMSGTHQQMRGFYTHTEQLSRHLNRLFVERTKLTMEQLREFSLEEHWFDSETALEYGFVDQLVKRPII